MPTVMVRAAGLELAQRFLTEGFSYQLRAFAASPWRVAAPHPEKPTTPAPAPVLPSYVYLGVYFCVSLAGP